MRRRCLKAKLYTTVRLTKIFRGIFYCIFWKFFIYEFDRLWAWWSQITFEIGIEVGIAMNCQDRYLNMFFDVKLAFLEPKFHLTKESKFWWFLKIWKFFELTSSSLISCLISLFRSSSSKSTWISSTSLFDVLPVTDPILSSPIISDRESKLLRLFSYI